MRCIDYLFVIWMALGMLAACAGAPEPVETAAVVEPAAGPAAGAQQQASTEPALPWPAAASCRELLTAILAMPEPELRRLEPAASPIAFGVRDAGAMLPPAAARAEVTEDLPLPAKAGTGARCLVVIDRAPTRRAAPRRSLAHEVVQSTFRAGNDRRANPDHAALRQRLRDLEDDDGLGIMATGDPGLDLIGLVGGVVLNGMDRFSRAQKAAALRERLAATPATLTSQSWEPYTFEVTTIETMRTGELRAALVDRSSGLAWPVERNIVERRSFKVASGRRARDRGLLEGGGAGLVETADVAVWEQGGLRPSLLAVSGLLAAQGTPGVAGAMAALPGVEPPPTGSEETGRSGAVEQTVGADGVRRYRLHEPEPAAGPTVEP